MEKTFEPQFAEIQSDMVSLCLEYCEDAASEVYIVTVYHDDAIWELTEKWIASLVRKVTCVIN
jgi:hypothetical protein